MSMYLSFELGDHHYAVEARHVVEIVPMVALEVPELAGRWIAGELDYRGRRVRVVDLVGLTGGRAAREALSTRILIVALEEPVIGDAPVLGLLTERLTSTLECDARDFVAPPIQPEGSDYLCGIRTTPQGMVYLLNPAGVLKALNRTEEPSLATLELT